MATSGDQNVDEIVSEFDPVAASSRDVGDAAATVDPSLGYGEARPLVQGLEDATERARASGAIPSV